MSDYIVMAAQRNPRFRWIWADESFCVGLLGLGLGWLTIILFLLLNWSTSKNIK